MYSYLKNKVIVCILETYISSYLEGSKTVKNVWLVKIETKMKNMILSFRYIEKHKIKIKKVA